MPADVEIKISLKNIDGTLYAVPELPPPGVMMKGKTVHYFNDLDLPVEIIFVTASPFAKSKMTSDDVASLIASGQFLCGCRIFTKRGDKSCFIGWMPGERDSPSGGIHDVGPH